MSTVIAVSLAVFLLVQGIAHFLVPDYVRALVPSWLGRADIVVPAGGGALVLDAVLILLPPTRAAGAWIAAALICVFMVSHLDSLVTAATGRRAGHLAGAVVKVLLNIAYVGWAVLVATTTT